MANMINLLDAPQSVLVVDDCPLQQKLISYILQSNGLKVRVASDGIEALEMIQTQIPDLVVTDIEMPRMNGYEFCLWLKERSQTENIPVVVCSGKVGLSEFRWGLRQSANVYLTKPVNATELVRTVQQLLHRAKI